VTFLFFLGLGSTGKSTVLLGGLQSQQRFFWRL
jgi:hypothetical protein